MSAQNFSRKMPLQIFNRTMGAEDFILSLNCHKKTQNGRYLQPHISCFSNQFFNRGG